ncbi:MAG TPA: glycogen synthase GlgA [candidate division Zixibacteria bacterium]|nr:glycogen synthase GlgA [candidate division Zixibacteria bacterium]
MSNEIKVLLASAEVFPFAKVGGLADVAGSLPKPLKQKGVDIRVILPLYDTIDREKFAIEFSGVEFAIAMGEENVGGKLYRGKFPDDDIPAYFIECPKYFGRPGIYTDPDTGEAYPDDGERFVFFSKAVPEALRGLGWTPDVIHANDYQTGLVPAIYKKLMPDAKMAFLFSIHNLAYQGRFEPELLDLIGFGHDEFYPTGAFEFFGKVNLMKIGIVFSDIINTVSPTYAEEIQSSEEFGHGLEGVLRSINDRLFGVLNGIDQTVWNPLTDKDIPYNFSADDLSGKRMCKAALLKQYGLPEDRIDKPLVATISRLADQKGFDLLIPIMKDIVEMDATFVLLGTGQKEYERAFTELAEKYPKNVGVLIGFDNKLAHLIEAGADMFLMPSRYEPCGLNQMYSMAYGTIPIVRKTGGLADTVTPANLATDEGTGFVFEEYSQEAFLAAIRRGLSAYRDKQGWRNLQLRAMAFDSSWENSAEKYIELFKQALASARWGD